MTLLDFRCQPEKEERTARPRAERISRAGDGDLPSPWHRTGSTSVRRRRMRTPVGWAQRTPCGLMKGLAPRRFARPTLRSKQLDQRLGHGCGGVRPKKINAHCRISDKVTSYQYHGG